MKDYSLPATYGLDLDVGPDGLCISQKCDGEQDNVWVDHTQLGWLIAALTEIKQAHDSGALE